MANYGQMSMNNLGMNINTIGMTINNNNNNNNAVPVNGMNNIALQTRVNVINNPLAVGNPTAVGNVNGNYEMVNIANQNVANVQLRGTTVNPAASTNVGANRIVGTAGLTYANTNQALLQQRVTTNQIPAANVQASNIYNTYPLNANLINVGKKNLNPVNAGAATNTAIGNVGQRLIQTYSNANMQATQIQKPIQINTLQAQNIQLLNQNAVLANTSKAVTPTLVQPPQQQRSGVTTPVQSTTTPLNLQDKAKTEILSSTTSAITPPVSLTKENSIATANEKISPTSVKNLSTDGITTPIASTAQSLSTLTPNSEGSSEISKVNSLNLKEGVVDKTSTEIKPVLTPPVAEPKDIQKTQLPQTGLTNISSTTSTTTGTGLITPTNSSVTYPNTVQKKGSLVVNGATNSTSVTGTNISYNQGQNMYQKQYIASTPSNINYSQTAVANNYQVNKTFYPNGTNQTAYLNQIAAVKPLNGSTIGVQQAQQQPQQKYYTIANGTYSNVSGAVQTGIKTVNPAAPVSYTVGNNQKYVIPNAVNNTLLNNRVQYPINNQVTNVYQVSNNNAVKVNGYMNNGQVVMNTINNGQVSYVKVNPTVNGNVISNPTNLVNYNGANTTLLNNANATTNPYLNKAALPNGTLLANNVNGGFVKPLNTTTNGDNKFMQPNQLSSFLLTPPTTTSTTSSRRRSDILRPPNPFILYRQEHHSKVLAEHEGISNTEISKIIGKMWKNESEEVKNKYKEKAQEMKRRHKLMYPDYRFAPRKQEEIRRRKKRKNVNPNPENTEADKDKDKKDVKKEEVKTESKTASESETVENPKKKLKTEEKSEIKKEVSTEITSNTLIENDLTKKIEDSTSTTSLTTTNNIPVSTDDSSNNIITSTSLFSDLESNFSNINSFDIENFDIAEDNSFIDNYLSFNSSNHTFQTTSADSLFNELTNLINPTGKK